MKRTLLFLLLLFAGNVAVAQDYAPLPDTGIRHYFTNAAGYLRGIRVDSVIQEAGYKRYVTFRTARGWKNYSELADSNGACWVGKNVRAYPNGDWHFPNVAGDTILVKTTAKVGDTWTFHRDTSAIWTEAKVLSTDTQTVFGVLDSVKRIQLTLKNGSGTLSSNPISAFQIILSKTMGFAQVPDLYLFPYNDLDSAQNKQDYWYQKLQLWGSSTTVRENLLFTHVIGWNPTEREMYDLQVGDITYGGHYASYVPIGDSFLDTVIARQDFSTYTEYTYNSWWWRHSQSSTGPTLTIQHRTNTLQRTNKPGFDMTHMPEEYFEGYYQSFYLDFTDTSFCRSELLVTQIVGDGCRLYVKGFLYPAVYKFKKGLGKVYYRGGDGDGNTYRDDLFSYVRNGVPCGSIPMVPSSIENVLIQATEFGLYPQPATTEVFLEASQLRYPATIRIQNLQGQLLSTQELQSAGKAISTANLPAGLYLISVTDASGKSAVQKLLIEAK